MPNSEPANPKKFRLVASILFAATAVALLVGRAMGWLPFTWLETFGAITGAACVLLVVWGRVWNFPVGIASSLAYLVFFGQGKLYADAGLQIVFILLAIHGWIAWKRTRQTVVPIRRVPLGELTILAVIFPSVWLGLTWLLQTVGGAAPLLDAFVTTASLISQWLLNRRYIESWLGWIAVDQVSVALFWSREMYLTSGLYAVFLGMCVAGLLAWRRQLVPISGRVP